MSDPNYEHPFWPNRKGLCTRIISRGHCGLPVGAEVHTRWVLRHATCYDVHKSVVISEVDRRDGFILRMHCNTCGEDFEIAAPE